MRRICPTAAKRSPRVHTPESRVKMSLIFDNRVQGYQHVCGCYYCMVCGHTLDAALPDTRSGEGGRNADKRDATILGGDTVG